MLITDTKKIETYYQALLNRDPAYVGVFYAGVKTTSIVCLSTCRARNPKFENVEFYSTFKEALNAGYRPCKICKPAESTNETPAQVKTAINMVKDNPKEKMTGYRLKQNEISPELVRRWFKKNYGMTFQAFQRMYRINNAYLELKTRKRATETVLDTACDPSIGFAYTYKKPLARPPKSDTAHDVILINRFPTPLGPMFVCATNKGVCLLEFVDRRMLETEFKDLQRLLKTGIVTGENTHIKQAKKEIAEYFDGKRKVFEVELHTPGTEFQNTAWKALNQIPYGTTSTYQLQAERIGKPKAIRAVATANGFNRISIIVPCHRVIGKDGKLRGYGGGLERKQWLIDHEYRNSSKL